ncbi:hypothetical protein S40288_09591 [Stachybotrys chartarum IBT 40288]|nr:hypothetical protein S40288_09591 [Stachybotrys chartarum IBT 40288]
MDEGSDAPIWALHSLQAHDGACSLELNIQEHGEMRIEGRINYSSLAYIASIEPTAPHGVCDTNLIVTSYGNQRHMACQFALTQGVELRLAFVTTEHKENRYNGQYNLRPDPQPAQQRRFLSENLYPHLSATLERFGYFQTWENNEATSNANYLPPKRLEPESAVTSDYSTSKSNLSTPSLTDLYDLQVLTEDSETASQAGRNSDQRRPSGGSNSSSKRRRQGSNSDDETPKEPAHGMLAIRGNRTLNSDRITELPDSEIPEVFFTALQAPEIGLMGAYSDALSQVYILDSGASQHMFWRPGNFSNRVPYTGPGVRGIADSLQPAESKGTYTLEALCEGRSTRVNFRNSLFAPALGVNLISVSALTKEGAEVTFTQTNATVKRCRRIRLDLAGENFSHEIRDFCQDRGIYLSTSDTEQHESNGLAERYQGHLKDMLTAALEGGRIKLELWDIVLTSGCIPIRNRSPTRNSDKTPYERWHGSIPDLDHLRVLSSPGWAKLIMKKQKKPEPTAEPVQLLGFKGSRSYVVINEQGRIYDTQDVQFNESALKRKLTDGEFPPAKKAEPLKPCIVLPDRPRKTQQTPTMNPVIVNFEDEVATIESLRPS